MGTTLARERAPGEPVLEYRTTLFSIPFYIQDRVVVYENNFYRKKYRDERLPDHVLPDAPALAAFVRTHAGIWVVTDAKKEPELAAEIPGLTLVMREGNHSLWASDPVVRRLESSGLLKAEPPGLRVSAPAAVSPGGPSA